MRRAFVFNRATRLADAHFRSTEASRAATCYTRGRRHLGMSAVPRALAVAVRFLPEVKPTDDTPPLDQFFLRFPRKVRYVHPKISVPRPIRKPVTARVLAVDVDPQLLPPVH